MTVSCPGRLRASVRRTREDGSLQACRPTDDWSCSRGDHLRGLSCLLYDRRSYLYRSEDELAVFVEPSGGGDPLPWRSDLTHEMGQAHRVEDDERARGGRHVDVVRASKLRKLARRARRKAWVEARRGDLLKA